MIKLMDVLNEYLLNEFLFGIWTEGDLKERKWKFDKEYVKKEYDPLDFNKHMFKIIQDPRIVSDENRVFSAYYTIYKGRKYRLLLTPYVTKRMNYVFMIICWDVESGEQYYKRAYDSSIAARKQMKQYIGMFFKTIKIPSVPVFNPYDKEK